MRIPKFLAGALSALAVMSSMATVAVTAAPEPAQAAGVRPLFQLPFPCGESWRLQTYVGHDDYDIDMFATSGSTDGRTIVASYAGTVAASGFDSGGGNFVRIDHGNGWQTRYLHMKYSPPVQTGQRVNRGQAIGIVGSTGRSSAPHLHFEQLRDMQKVESWFDGRPSGITTDGSPSSEPLSKPVTLVSQNCGSGGVSRAVADYDGDGRSDLALYRRDSANGSAWWARTVGGDDIYGDHKWGGAGDIPISGDFNGDGTADPALFRPDCTNGSTLWVKDGRSGDQLVGGQKFGGCKDIPASGDFNGDGSDDLGLYRQDCADGSTWWAYSVKNSGQIVGNLKYGGCKDIPASSTAGSLV